MDIYGKIYLWNKTENLGHFPIKCEMTKSKSDKPGFVALLQFSQINLDYIILTVGKGRGEFGTA